MSEEQVDKGVKRRKRLKFFLFKVPIFFMIIGAILIGALKLVERYPDPLRQGFEEYLSKSTNTNATIGQLKVIKFFPVVTVHAQNITFHNAANAALIDLEIEDIKFSAPFGSMFLGAGKFNSFELKNFVSEKNFLSANRLEIISAKIINEKGPDQFGSFLKLVGNVNERAAEIEIEIEPLTYNYRLGKTIPFSLSVGEYLVSATLQRNFKNVEFENLVFSKGDNQAKAKNYFLNQKNDYQKNNPVHCLLMGDDINKCDVYLKEE